MKVKRTFEKLMKRKMILHRKKIFLLAALSTLAGLSALLFCDKLPTRRERPIAWIGEPISYESGNNTQITITNSLLNNSDYPGAAGAVLHHYNDSLKKQTEEGKSTYIYTPDNITLNQLTAGWLPLRDRIQAASEEQSGGWQDICFDYFYFWEEVEAYRTYVKRVKSKSPDGEWHGEIAKATPRQPREIIEREAAVRKCIAFDE
ncbi:hypothetical protein [cf. Phormidesmis sp. LEGE 11477]|uniref:hypothetical protein n=1 Tax=cf. Phormidesmis sp. LEGE 11477 TaxID=1828680 RepID=UPI001881F772|nr:hypothetical protein [cf. Phormidesmis sp. LEGE 11477]MBE9064111.1 hypothetical protein [cf. Phormidesmis sp. LEGE 11477]